MADVTKKRANGEGSVRPFGTGWRGGIVIDGRRIWRQAPTKKAVLAALDEVKAQHATTGVVARRDLTVGQLAESWFQAKKPQWTDGTQLAYRSCLDCYVIPKLGSRRAAELTPDDVRSFQDSMKEKYAPKTIRRAHSVLTGLLEHGVRDGRIPRNVGKLVDQVPLGKSSAQWYTTEEIRTLLDGVAGTPDEARVHLALLGIRQGEVLAMRWRDIDLDAGTLQVTGTLTQKVGGGRQVKPPKWDSGRPMDLPAQTVEVLKRHRQAQAEWMLRTGVRDEFGFLFLHTDGQPVRSQRDRERWYQLLSELGLRKIKVHDGRHSYATAMLGAGADPMLVAKSLGHKNLNMIFKVYGHTSDEVKARTKEMAEKALFG